MAHVILIIPFINDKNCKKSQFGRGSTNIPDNKKLYGLIGLCLLTIITILNTKEKFKSCSIFPLLKVYASDA
ncbi:hypothetical protein CF386_09355 [Paraphotobacterium marinum]|uniref:Uncharacterized protein n=1 Tax=Paraphotobacterium marinum TaxID=1755811 RepID=A0A220VFX4_9GAMM|nr:hypothetical protein CF386_09355 [Paraphotobacterium marinum]